ncbi:hypothetical protein LZF95_21125 [Algoriphagus sp. AGSA1]|uniref:hypothetical protein n=1 Tax=Algoriphagus sp. AGSA1 TaxID=2907213 RepID=UPI001F3BA9D5|nr:hypothetical protein [Algoriphagus sp. AGSA1]MCE7057197.1 hypothetical protein [Algoriphagus sp. AGSA1]
MKINFRINFILTILIAVFSFLSCMAQNEFPTAKNSSVKIDGGGLLFVRPATTGGWARGLNFHYTDMTGYMALGTHGNNESVSRFYIAYGATPWTSGQGIYILPNGNTGIGTISPSTKLSVNGIIKAMEVNITTDGWADYVFKPEYKLMPLSELETFIQRNGHLPDVPTEAEVMENGVNLAEMNVKLLEKVEELTLYLITLQKNNEAMKRRIEFLEENAEQ